MAEVDEEIFSGELIKQLEYLSLLAKRYYKDRRLGVQRSLFKGASIEFHDYRAYTPGDDFRNVDWHIYSRFDELFIKLFEHEQEVPVYVLLDTSRSMLKGSPTKARFALEVAATIAYLALSNQDRVLVFSFAQDVQLLGRPLRGKGNIYNLFRLLSDLTWQGGTSLEASVKGFTSRSLPRGIVVVISDFLSPSGVLDPLRDLVAHRYELITIHLAAEEDRRADFDGQVELRDSESGELHPLFVTRDIQERYAALFEEFCHEVEEVCTRAGMVYVFAGVENSLAEIILGLLRQGGLVGK